MEIFWDYIKNNYPNLLGIFIYIGILFPSIILNLFVLSNLVFVIIILPFFLLVILTFPSILDNNRSYTRTKDLLGALGFWIGVNTDKIYKQILEDLPVFLIKGSITKFSKRINNIYLDKFELLFIGFIDGRKKNLNNLLESKNNFKEIELKWWMRILLYPPGLVMMIIPFLLFFIFMFLFSFPLWILIIWIVEYV